MLDLKTFMLRAKNVYPPSTLEKKLLVLKKYDEFLEEQGLKPGLESLSLWLDHLTEQGLSEGSLKIYCYHVLSYFELLMMDLDPQKLKFLKRRLPSQDVGEVDFLSEEEVARIIDGAYIPHKLIYALMYTYARRLGEVLLLTRKDIDFENDMITFRIIKKRKNETATFKLEGWIKDMLREYLQSVQGDQVFPITARAVQIDFKRTCRRLGIEEQGRRLTPHILRHSRITHLRDRGVPLDVVSKRIARHSRFDTTIKFYRGITEREEASIPEAGKILEEALK